MNLSKLGINKQTLCHRELTKNWRGLKNSFLNLETKQKKSLSCLVDVAAAVVIQGAFPLPSGTKYDS